MSKNMPLFTDQPCGLGGEAVDARIGIHGLGSIHCQESGVRLMTKASSRMPVADGQR